ncbi:MAG: diguanylate cyclase, partial [Leptolyngbya sp. SIO3F4]|nr:diguanylate cyclase [Leptolyngbya sp. SIO3F4]
MPKEADPNSLIHHLRTTLGKMEVALDAVTDAIVWTNELGKIQWCNALFEKLVQKKQLMILGKKLPNVLKLSQNDQALTSKNHPGSLALGQKCQGTDFYEFYRDDILHILEISWASIQFNDAEDHDAPATSAVLAIRDVTEKKQAEAELDIFQVQL